MTAHPNIASRSRSLARASRLQLLGALTLLTVFVGRNAHAGSEIGPDCMPELTLDGRYLVVIPNCKTVEGVVDLETLTWVDDQTKATFVAEHSRRVRPVRSFLPDDKKFRAFLNTRPEYGVNWYRAWHAYTIPHRDLIVRIELVKKDWDRVPSGNLRVGPVAMHKADSAVDRGSKAHRARRWDAAAEAYTEALTQWPTHAAARYNLACVEARRKNADTAIALLEALVVDYPEVRANLAGDKDLRSLAKDARFLALAPSAPGKPVSTSMLPALGRDHTPVPLTTIPAADLLDIITKEGDGFTYDRDKFIAAVPNVEAFAAHAYFEEKMTYHGYFTILRDATPNGFFDIVLGAREHMFRWGDEELTKNNAGSVDLTDLYQSLSARETIWIGGKRSGAVVLRPR